MKTRTLLLAAVPAIALTASAQAGILASWDVWTDATGTTYDADFELTGFEGTIVTVDPNNRVNSTGFGSNDGTFGTVVGAANSDDTALLLRASNLSAGDPKGYNVATINITNNTGSAYNIESVHFDIGRRGTAPTQSSDTYSLVYTSGGLGPVSTLVGSATGITNVGNLGNADDFDINLASFLSDIILADGESATFTLTLSGWESQSASGTVDNVAIQGSIVPEPSSLALLGLGGLLIARRRRG